MTKKLHTITPTTDLFEIAKIMSDKNLRRLPVVVKGKLYGLVTVKDLIKAEPHVVEVLADKLKIRGKELKFDEREELEGICEVCGNYSYDLRSSNSGLICSICSDEKELDTRY
jgi:hypothetical protein